MEGEGGRRREPISALGLALRASWCLDASGVATVGDLCRRSAGDLLAIEQFGEATLAEVRGRLAERGLALRGEVARPA